MDQFETALRTVVGDIGKIVANDGGSLKFTDYQPDSRQLTVAFAPAGNDECSTCSIDAAMVRAFLTEAAKAHDVPVETLHIDTPSAT